MISKKEIISNLPVMNKISTKSGPLTESQKDELKKQWRMIKRSSRRRGKL